MRPPRVTRVAGPVPVMARPRARRETCTGISPSKQRRTRTSLAPKQRQLRLAAGGALRARQPQRQQGPAGVNTAPRRQCVLIAASGQPPAGCRGSGCVLSARNACELDQFDLMDLIFARGFKFSRRSATTAASGACCRRTYRPPRCVARGAARTTRGTRRTRAALTQTSSSGAAARAGAPTQVVAVAAAAAAAAAAAVPTPTGAEHVCRHAQSPARVGRALISAPASDTLARPGPRAAGRPPMTGRLRLRLRAGAGAMHSRRVHQASGAAENVTLVSGVEGTAARTPT